MIYIYNFQDESIVLISLYYNNVFLVELLHRPGEYFRFSF
jgi:hypothetical protein